jgi:hypothetical protein
VLVRPLAFKPPGFALDAGLEWILMRALGPLEWRPSTPLAGDDRLFDTALQLDVASRIAARHPVEALTRELGPDVVQRFREEYLHTVARDALLGRALDLLLRLAATAGVPCILLKYAALARMEGILSKGARSATDLDVLVPNAAAKGFRTRLLKEGYVDTALPASAHQLSALRDPHGVLVELHVHVPGVNLGMDQPFLRAQDLIERGLTHLAGEALIPAPAVLIAHALAHGLVQHARAPHMYSPLKTFADLADLRQAGHAAFEDSLAYLAGAMTGEDARDALVLAKALGDGALDGAMRGSPGVLLRHALASRLDSRYAARLRLRLLTAPGPTGWHLRHLTAGRLAGAVREAWNLARCWGRQGRMP